MDIVQAQGPAYIQTSSALRGQGNRVLKNEVVFAVVNELGDVPRRQGYVHGVFRDCTRFLSCWELRLNGHHPFLLSSSVIKDNSILTIDLTNPDMELERSGFLARGTLHLLRSKFIWDGVCHERLRVKNYGPETVYIPITYRVESDFADIFELRGTKRASRGEYLEPKVAETAVRLSYRGLDKQVRSARVHFNPTPTSIEQSEVTYYLSLERLEQTEINLTLDTREEDKPVPEFNQSFTRAMSKMRTRRSQECQIQSSNEQFNEWVNRSVSDLHMLTTEMKSGPYPFAGIPWFSTVFGRDGIITALQTLWVNPGLAKGVLSYLSKEQSTSTDPYNDAAPGKILHEVREGEMADLGEVPFRRTYSTVDATPLYVYLAGEYLKATDDVHFIEGIWPNIKAALGWIDTEGDRDGDGFVEYGANEDGGLVNQGWKDSHDSVSHASGELASGPIALSEVQAYVFAAKCAAAEMATVIGDGQLAHELKRQSEQLREAFEEAFWSDELGYYALALDGEKAPCEVIASNAGQCLFSQIVHRNRAERMRSVLFSPEMFSGWGIRTLASHEVRYNPMSYHNGSIWPHDNALIALGLSMYGFKHEACRLLACLYDASLNVSLHRLPELYCGIARRPNEGPTEYPVACNPQAWASGSVFMLIRAILGLSVEANTGSLKLIRPTLPAFVPQLSLRNLRVGKGRVDINLSRYAEENVGVNIFNKTSDVTVSLIN